MFPDNYKYTKDHEWVAVDGDIGTIGITDYAQKELGDIVFVELPEVGQELKAGETLGNIESVKAVSELFSPVTGVVLEINEALEEQAEIVNQDPHGGGWIVRIKLAEPGELDELMDAEAYGSLVG
ncbi:MAG: glycine cleavage system protein GcvH [Acidobacteria bacterium]|uniref:Glycine cleavage system H protein n=1 Tax=Candidatus Polarisedimenticola svalbardensis TaxID=2886004 RepID=A0A8J6Y508_9BACT|nr:glycine cleavage system protein GcvH [Candidatus Polarisedimenticola svalbardensis]